MCQNIAQLRENCESTKEFYIEPDPNESCEKGSQFVDDIDECTEALTFLRNKYVPTHKSESNFKINSTSLSIAFQNLQDYSYIRKFFIIPKYLDELTYINAITTSDVLIDGKYWNKRSPTFILVEKDIIINYNYGKLKLPIKPHVVDQKLLPKGCQFLNYGDDFDISNKVIFNQNNRSSVINNFVGNKKQYEDYCKLTYDELIVKSKSWFQENFIIINNSDPTINWDFIFYYDIIENLEGIDVFKPANILNETLQGFTSGNIPADVTNNFKNSFRISHESININNPGEQLANITSSCPSYKPATSMVRL